MRSRRTLSALEVGLCIPQFVDDRSGEEELSRPQRTAVRRRQVWQRAEENSLEDRGTPRWSDVHGERASRVDGDILRFASCIVKQIVDIRCKNRRISLIPGIPQGAIAPQPGKPG